MTGIKSVVTHISVIQVNYEFWRDTFNFHLMNRVPEFPEILTAS